MNHHDFLASRLSLLLAVSLICLIARPALSEGPINSDVAFTPRKGGSILRLQYAFSETDASGSVRRVSRSEARGTYVYGVEENLALFLSVPYVHRETNLFMPKLGPSKDTVDGIGDVTFLAKYRFFQRDYAPLETARWAVLGGLNVRSGDSDISSDSYDPILGTVFTWRRDRNLFDADLIYQFNTGGGERGHDRLRYDLAWSYRLFPAVFEPGDSSALDFVAEMNGHYRTDGSHELFLSPGLQYSTEDWTLESSIQVPVVQDLAGDGPETKYRFVIGVRFHW